MCVFPLEIKKTAFLDENSKIPGGTKPLEGGICTLHWLNTPYVHNSMKLLMKHIMSWNLS